MYHCCNCGGECSGMGRCAKCGGALCFLCAVFIKDGREVGFITPENKPHCEACAKIVINAHDEGEDVAVEPVAPWPARWAPKFDVGAA